jgi:hypothetical protein
MTPVVPNIQSSCGKLLSTKHLCQIPARASGRSDYSVDMPQSQSEKVDKKKCLVIPIILSTCTSDGLAISYAIPCRSDYSVDMRNNKLSNEICLSGHDSMQRACARVSRAFPDLTRYAGRGAFTILFLGLRDDRVAIAVC